MRLEASEVDGRVFDVCVDVDVIREDAAADLGGNEDLRRIQIAHWDMPSSAWSRGVFFSATRNRSTSEPRSVTGPRRATPSVA